MAMESSHNGIGHRGSVSMNLAGIVADEGRINSVGMMEVALLGILQ